MAPFGPVHRPTMPALEGPWSPELGQDEAPRPRVWGRLKMALALELQALALARQLRAAWRAPNGRTRTSHKCQAGAWVQGDYGEDEDEDERAKRGDAAHLEGVGTPNSCLANVLLAERRGSYPLTDKHIVKASDLDSLRRRRKLKTLLSFQRFCQASRLLIGIVPPSPDFLHLLDSDYLGQAARMLSKVGSWDFDVFLFERLTNGNSLATLVCHLFNVLGLVAHLRLDVVKLHRFLGMLQRDYHSHNPYHNAVHAADVTQAMYCYLREDKLADELSPLDVFLGLMAAAAHDVGHPGVNQPFLIKTRHHLASLYQNMSVLESHHWRSTVGILRESRLLSHLPRHQSHEMEQRLGSLILATDISRQSQFLLSLRAHLDQRDLDLRLASHRHFVLQIGLKCADVCNPCRDWSLSKRWSERVCEELFRQGDLERKFNLEVSPLCDQKADSIPAIQTGFISYIVEPLFTEWRRFTGPSVLSRAMMAHLRRNKVRWTRLLRDAQAEEDVP
ncbi:3',5'-cyclic-AMP phosphodiesterase 7B-like isoform X4 [Vanacampus margaritifer]